MSTTIRTMIQRLDVSLAGAQSEDQRAELLGHARKRLQKLEWQRQRLGEAYRTIDGLRERGLEVEDVSPPANSLINALLDERQRANTSMLAAGEGDEPSVLAMLETHAEQAIGGARLAWARFRGRHPVPDVDDDLLSVTEGPHGPLRQRLKSAESELEELRTVALPTPQQLERWVELSRSVSEIASTVAEEADSVSVVQFLKAAQTPAGAPLEMVYDPEVQTYLRDKNRMRQYRVRPFGRSPTER